jgi:tetratricopeptide (TPR) repeat protein
MRLRDCRFLPGCLFALLAVAAAPATAVLPDPAQAPTATPEPTPEQARALAVMKDRLEAASRALAAGRLDETIRLAKQVIAAAGSDKGAVPAYELLASALYQKHDVDGATAALQRVLEIDPRSGEALASLAGIALNAGHVNEARQYLERALQVTPDLPGAHERLGVVLQQQGDIAGATREYELGLLKTRPDYVGAKLRLAELYNRQGRPADAVRLLEPIVRPDSKDGGALMLLGNAYLGAGEASKALPLISAAQQLDRSDNRIGLALGIAQRMAGLNQAALDRLGQVVKAMPDSAVARYELGLTYIALKQYSDARAALAAAAKLDPKSVGIAQMLGETMLLEGKPDEAIAFFQERVKRDGATLPEFVSLANADMAAKHPADADAALRDAIAHFPKDPEAYGRLGAMLAQQRNYDDALKVLGEGSQLAPDNPRILNDTALVEARLGHFADAISVAQHLVALLPKSTGSRFLLGSLVEASGDKAQAIAIYRAILADDPEHAEALNNLASCLTETGEAAAAVPLARHAAGLMPDSADVTDTLGWALLQAGEAAEAVRTLKTANRLRGDDPTLMYHLAVAQKQAGDGQAARATIASALKLPGEFKDAAAARALLAELSK